MSRRPASRLLHAARLIEGRQPPLARADGRIVRTGASRASAVSVTRFLGASRTERC